MSNEKKQSSQNLRVGITIGDINGIGPELIVRAFSDSKLWNNFTPIIYGSSKVLNIYKKVLNDDSFSYQVINDARKANSNKVSLIECGPKVERVEIGRPTEEAGRSAFECLSKAVSDLKTGDIDTLVTLPIDKSSIQRDDFKFPGHTEFLASTFDAKEHLMFMLSERLKVAVVTGHIPVKDIADQLTAERIHSKIVLLNQSLKMDFNIDKPRIAVLGLNPHAGDRGLLGSEDQEIIAEAIKLADRDRIFCLGPYSPDGFFGSGQFMKFDAVLAMYHDQGLIPFKLLSGFTGVNYTAGLPYVRTSPDHGVAYDLAGKNEADIFSFINSIHTAIDIYRDRKENEEGVQNAMRSDTRNKPRKEGIVSKVEEALTKEENEEKF